MVCFMAHKRQFTIVGMTVLLMLLASLLLELTPALAQNEPTISLDPTEGPPGTEVTVQGSGWVAGDIVSIQLGGPQSGAQFNEVAPE